MRSRREDTVVLTDLGSFFFAFFPVVLFSRRLRIRRVCFSPASAARVQTFFALSIRGRIARIVRETWRSRRLAPLWCYGFLWWRRALVGTYDPNHDPPMTADYVCSLGYLRRIPAEQIAAARTTSNVHWSLLPRYAGCHPFYWIFRHAERESGVTIHQLSDTYDAGDILMQRRVPIAAQDTCDEFRAAARRISIAAFRAYIRNKDAYDASARPQDHARYVFFTTPTEADHRLDPDDSADELLAKFRASGRGRCFVETSAGRAAVVGIDALDTVPPRGSRPMRVGPRVVHVREAIATT